MVTRKAVSILPFELDEPKTPAFLKNLREQGKQAFYELGFPSTRSESWRYTNVIPITQRTYRQAPEIQAQSVLTAEKVAALSFGDWKGSQLVFLNGRFVPSLSHLEPNSGVELVSLAQALGKVESLLGKQAKVEHSGFLALNTSSFEDGVYLRIAANCVVETPIQLLYLMSPVAPDHAICHPRNLIFLERGASASLVEVYESLTEDNGNLTNAVSEITLGEGASLKHVKVQRESRLSSHIASTHVSQSKDSRFESHYFSFGGQVVRNEIFSALRAPGADCTLNGLYLAHDGQHVDNYTEVQHESPECSSHQYYKAILDGNGVGVFQGKILVQPNAQKTSSQQTNKALLLSRDATINTKPQLEIYADDVKCSHGAAVGQLDEAQLFYLRSRGLGPEAAREMLTYAFAAEMLTKVNILDVKCRLNIWISPELARSIEGLEA